jgi:multidrug efflux pump subunit AcrA (membrane-fusion protein)
MNDERKPGERDQQPHETTIESHDAPRPDKTLPSPPDEAKERELEKRHEQRIKEHKKRMGGDEHPAHGPHVEKKTIIFWVAVGVGILLLLALLAWIPRHIRNKKIKQEAATRAKQAPQVEVVQVQRAKQAGDLTIPGTTSPFTEANIYARANGYLRARYVDIGDHVRKGQLLALIDSPDLDAQVEQAREQLHQAESQLEQQQAQLDLTHVTVERWRVLVAKGVFSQQDGDQKETDYRAQQQNVAAAARNVEAFRDNLAHAIALQSYERVTAPFDGVITARNVDVGALISATGTGLGGGPNATPSPSSTAQPSGNSTGSNNTGSSGSSATLATPSTGESQGGQLFSEAEVDKLRILVSVPEGYAAGLRTGVAAALHVQELPGQTFFGTVARTTGSIDQNTRTMLTEIDYDNRDNRLMPGMYTVVSFTQEQGVAPLIVPGDAVALRQDRSVLAVIQNDTVHFAPVEIGRDFGPVVEILGGVQEGQYIASVITDDVREGARIQPKVLQQEGEAGGNTSGGSETEKTPASGPNQYGDQSITNQKTEATTQSGKKSGGSQQKSGGSSGGKP